MPGFPLKRLASQKLPRKFKGFVAVPLLNLASTAYVGQTAFAGDCTVGTTSVCSGPAAVTDVPQAIDSPTPISVTTQSGFGLSVSVADNGIDLRGQGGVSFIDRHQSNITTAGMFGIYVSNDAGGDLNITATGSVTAASMMGEGIRGDSYGANMLITANDTQGEGNGIGANGYGSGSVHVVSTGNATGLNSAGIYANMVAGTDLTIDALRTQGYANGIVAMTGTGALTVTSTGLATASNGTGIALYGRSGNLTLTASDTHGGDGNGIYADYSGTGTVRISSSGMATGSIDGIGVQINGGTDTTVSAKNTVGLSGAGIIVNNNAGTGAVQVSSTGTANGASDGIAVTNATGTSTTVRSADSLGASNMGILVDHSGSGPVQIDSTGTATGGYSGIAAYTYSSVDTTINAVDTQGEFGIAVSSRGGAVSVRSTGTATGTTSSGISVANAGAGDVSVTGTKTNGGLYGIYLLTTATGDVSITSTDSSAGVGMDGVYAETRGLGSAVNISVNDAQGGRSGVFVVNGSGASPATNTTNVVVLGHATGGTGAAISTASNSGGTSTVDVRSNALVESASGIAISNNGGDSHVIVRNGAVVNGAINLGAGNDTVDLLAGFSGITALDGGGGGVDTLNVSNAPGAVRAGKDIRNWSVLNLTSSDLTMTDAQLSVGTPSDWTTGVFVRDRSTLTLQQSGFVLNGNLSLEAGSALFGPITGSGSSTITGTVTNAGTITLAGANPGNVLTVGADYVGNAGVIALNTVLGNDASITDKLVINGGTEGTSVLKVKNAGGAGAATNEGIMLVSVGGTSNGVFSLASDYQLNGKPTVVAGAYAYQLYQGNASGTDSKNWYLRSEWTGAEPTAPVVKPAPPLYQPGVSTYEAYPQALLALNGVSTLQRRVGNRYWSGASGRQGAIAGPRAGGPQNDGTHIDGTGAWARFEGGNRRVEPSTSTSGTGFTLNYTKVQAGSDFLLSRRETGALVGGGYFQYVHGNTSTRSVYGNGDIATDGYGFGSTATWYGNGGFYVDGQAQVMWFSSDLNSRLAGRSLVKDNDGTGFAVSVESGKRIALNAEWSLTPQAQLTYSGVRFDRFDDAFGATVRSSRGVSLQSRVGVTLDRETRAGKDGMDRSHVYGVANLYYEFLDGSTVDVSGSAFRSRPDRLWGGIGAGASYNWGKDKYSFYAEGLLNTSLAHMGSNRSLAGTVGLRMRW